MIIYNSHGAIFCNPESDVSANRSSSRKCKVWLTFRTPNQNLLPIQSHPSNTIPHKIQSFPISRHFQCPIITLRTMAVRLKRTRVTARQAATYRSHLSSLMELDIRSRALACMARFCLIICSCRALGLSSPKSSLHSVLDEATTEDFLAGGMGALRLRAA